MPADDHSHWPDASSPPPTGRENAPALAGERPATSLGTHLLAWAALCLVLAWFWLPVLFRWHALDLPLVVMGVACLLAAFATSTRGSIGRRVAVVAAVVVVVEGLVVGAGLLLAVMLSALWSGG